MVGMNDVHNSTGSLLEDMKEQTTVNPWLPGVTTPITRLLNPRPLRRLLHTDTCKHIHICSHTKRLRAVGGHAALCWLPVACGRHAAETNSDARCTHAPLWARTPPSVLQSMSLSRELTNVTEWRAGVGEGVGSYRVQTRANSRRRRGGGGGEIWHSLVFQVKQSHVFGVVFEFTLMMQLPGPPASQLQALRVSLPPLFWSLSDWSCTLSCPPSLVEGDQDTTKPATQIACFHFNF